MTDAEKIVRLKRAAVRAVLPLEAMVMNGSWHRLSPDLRVAVRDGIRAVREALEECGDE